MRLGDFIFFILFRYIITIKLVDYVLDFSIFLFFLAITKRAQFPFSGWLPKAMRAPTPTRALVHSSTLVLAGLVLLIIYSKIIYRVIILLIMTVVGFFTIMFGRIMALG